MSEVKSPCISVCALDENDVCFGCYRTVEEIREWNGMDDEGKRAILVLANERSEGSSTIKLGQ